MGNITSCCLKGSPSHKRFLSIDKNDFENDFDDNNLILKLQHQIIQETELNSLYNEEILYQIYDLIQNNQTNKLQTFIYENNIDLTNVFWKNQLTPLHIAAMKGHLSTVQMLILNGLNPNIVDKLGRTPLHWAARNKHEDVYNFLYSVTNHTNRLDIYGISADSFHHSNDNSKEYSNTINHNQIKSSIVSPPLSLSSLTLHTISISSPEHSPRDHNDNYCYCNRERYINGFSPAFTLIHSPRTMNVSLQTDFPFKESSNLTKYNDPNTHFDETIQDQKSPFLIEENLDIDQYNSSIEWEPYDENLPPIVVPNNQFFNELSSNNNNQQNEQENYQYEDQVKLQLKLNPISNSDLMKKLTIDTNPKIKKFYCLRRKLSLMLFNTFEIDSDLSTEEYSDTKRYSIFNNNDNNNNNHNNSEHGLLQSPTHNPLSDNNNNNNNNDNHNNNHNNNNNNFDSTPSRLSHSSETTTTTSETSIDQNMDESSINYNYNPKQTITQKVKQNWKKLKSIDKKWKIFPSKNEKSNFEVHENEKNNDEDSLIYHDIVKF